MRRALPFLAAAVAFLAYAALAVSRPEVAANQGGWGTVAEPLADRIEAFFFGDKFWIGASYALTAGFTLFALTLMAF